MKEFERNNEFERTITKHGETEIPHLVYRYCEILSYGIIILTGRFAYMHIRKAMEQRANSLTIRIYGMHTLVYLVGFSPHTSYLEHVPKRISIISENDENSVALTKRAFENDMRNYCSGFHLIKDGSTVTDFSELIENERYCYYP